jgi:hypothetical protein
MTGMLKAYDVAVFKLARYSLGVGCSYKRLVAADLLRQRLPAGFI